MTASTGYPHRKRHPSVQHLLDLLTTPRTFDAITATPAERVMQSVNYTAHEVASQLGDGPELTTGLRHLLDAASCFHRQAQHDVRAEHVAEQQQAFLAAFDAAARDRKDQPQPQRCEGSGMPKSVPEVLCCCGQRLTVVDSLIPEHERTGPLVNGAAAADRAGKTPTLTDAERDALTPEQRAVFDANGGA